jgi:Acetyltransferase (GNAT) domain
MTDADLDDMASLLGDDDVMRYYPRPMSRSEAQDWIARNQRRYRVHGFGLWIVNLRGSGEFVGDCGLTLSMSTESMSWRSAITSGPACRARAMRPRPRPPRATSPVMSSAPAG